MNCQHAQRVFEKYSNLSFMKIRPMGAELFRADRRTEVQADGQTDMTNLMVAFRNLANAPTLLAV